MSGLLYQGSKSLHISFPPAIEVGLTPQKARTNLSDYVRRQAIDAAEISLMNRSTIAIPEDSWQAFEAWLERPEQPNKELANLAVSKPAWE